MRYRDVERAGSRAGAGVGRQQWSFAFLGVAATVALVGCGPAHPAAQGTDSSGSQSQASSSPSSSVSTSSPSLAAQVHTWAVNYGTPSLTALGADLSQFAADAQNQDFSAARTDCQHLETDVAHAKASPPNPDPRQQQHWSAALVDFHAAAKDCVSGARSTDASLVNAGDAIMGRGGAQLQIMTREIKQLYGK